MGKNKLQHFAEMKEFKHTFEGFSINLLNDDFHLKGKWNADFFKNNNPIVLELGCGKGEYTVGLAEKYPNKNFIGVDIKGARIWFGAKKALEANLNNVAFYRGVIEFINKVFAKNEISEIWITFPDPQRKKMRKRLTSARFLELYKEICIPNAQIHLKTDSKLLYYFTNELIKYNNLELEASTNDLYSQQLESEELSIRTFYEKMFLRMNDTITYTRFKLNDKPIENPDTREGEKQFDK